MKLVSARAMRALDERTINEAGTPGHVLMERAGAGAARAFVATFPEIVGKNVTVFCGKGNNGGDGLVIARLLSEMGTPARAALLGEAAGLSGDPARMLSQARAAGVRVDEVTSEDALSALGPALSESAGIVDALFGTGLERPVAGLSACAIERMNGRRRDQRALAVDISSGVDATTGAILGEALRADLTVTFGLPKLGHVLFPGAALAGRLQVVDIGIPETYVGEAEIQDAIMTRAAALRAFPDRPKDAHKGSFGHLLIIAGSPGKTGAAAMTAQAAMRCGTGLVTLAVPESLAAVLAVKLTEAMCEGVAETDARTLGRKASERIATLSEGKSALAIGPGLSTHPETVDLVRDLARTETRPMLMDADALNALAGHLDALADCSGPRVLTPHPGEMGRLLGVDAERVNADRIGAARGFARTQGVVLVLKGAHTVIAAPDGQVRVNLTGNPGMASGGMGDALSGIISGFLAQGVPPFEAACLGVYLHGLAGDLAARELGTVGLLASDLIARLPATIDTLLCGRTDATF